MPASRVSTIRSDDVNLLPKPAQQPCPIYIAGTPRSTQIGDRGVERSLRRIARFADGWMTNQIELERFRDYLGRLRVCWSKRDAIRRHSRPFCITASPSMPIAIRRFAKQKLFSMPIIKKTLRARASKSGTPAGRWNIALECVAWIYRGRSRPRHHSPDRQRSK